MKREVFLNHSAVITGLGDLDGTWGSLLKNETGIAVRSHFSNTLLEKTGVSLYNRGMTDDCADVTQGLMEECLAGLPSLPSDTFVIWTGIKNNVEAVERSCGHSDENSHKPGSGPELSSPFEFRRWVGEKLGLRGGGMEVNAACASSTAGVILAAQAISQGIYDHVLVAGADIVSRFVYFGFAALKALTEDVCRPFDVNRNGLTLGDGAAALFLSAERGSGVRVSGWGFTNDANHITGPSRDGAGLKDALAQSADRAGIKPGDVQAFCAHATGTRYNDAMELAAAATFFGGRRPPIFGVKGAIGHTLGAAGGIEVALCARCVSEGLLPPTVGCLDPETPDIVMEKKAFPGDNILTSNSGFGGVNAAVLLEKLS